MDRDRLRSEALRVNQRYLTEVVEALGMCPWAMDARTGGQLTRHVVFGEKPSVEEVIEHLEKIESNEQHAIGLIIFPEVTLDRAPFQRFTARVREADSSNKGVGNTVTALADFHPNALPDMETAERLVSFIRRSPDPTIQVVRRDALSSVRMTEDHGTQFLDLSVVARGGPVPPARPESLSRRIARANHRTVEKEGVEAVRRLLDAIRHDRDSAYAELGLTPSPWAQPPPD